MRVRPPRCHASGAEGEERATTGAGKMQRMTLAAATLLLLLLLLPLPSRLLLLDKVQDQLHELLVGRLTSACAATTSATLLLAPTGGRLRSRLLRRSSAPIIADSGPAPTHS